MTPYVDKYNVSLDRCFEDYRQLVKLPDIDVVDICTPNLFHSKVAIAALENGKHVFTEKPDAVDAREAQKMLDAAKASGKVLMAMRNNRFSQASQFLKQYIAQGNMGELYTGRCGWIRRRGIPGKGGWFTTKELSGGGPLIDLGVHMIDLATWLMGNPKPVIVTGRTYRKFATTEVSDSEHSKFGDKKAGGTFDVEDLATGMIRFANGATLQIEFSWASNIEEERHFVELRGDKGGFTIDNKATKIFTETCGVLCDVTPRFAPNPEGLSGHGQHLYHFIDVVQGRAKPINTPADGLNMIKILSAIYKSAQTGKEVRL
jgi:predicted dehydrogenase